MRTPLIRRPLWGLAMLMVVFAMACENLDNYGTSEVLNAPSGLIAVPASSSEIALTWERPVGVAGQITYRLFRNGVEVGTTTSTSYADGGLAPSTTYIYTASAIDHVGNSSPQSGAASATTLADGVTDTEPPTVPENLTAVAASSSVITLTWTPSSDGVGVLGYRIFRNGTEVGVSADADYTDTGLSASTAYTYTVAAFDGAGNTSAESNSASAMTLAAGIVDMDAPSIPTGLAVNAGSSSSAALSWDPSTDNVGVAGYYIYREGVQIATSIGASFTDTGLCPATPYAYTVAAFDGAGNVSGQSASASATTPNVAVNLGTAGNFGVLGSTGLNLTGLVPSLISGNVGTSPSNAVSGLLALLDFVTGSLHAGDGVAATAQVDLGNALNSLSSVACAANTLAGSGLGGLTLKAGVHQATSGATLNGTMTLDADGDPNAVFVIKVPGGLSVSPSAQVQLVDGAQPENVYWVVSGPVNLGALSTMRGNILTSSSATLGLGANVDGRVLSRGGSVSLAGNTIGL